MGEIILTLLIGAWISGLGIFLYLFLDKEEKQNNK